MADLVLGQITSPFGGVETEESKMKQYVVETQFLENYAAHDWDGTGECPNYWKFKGGEDFLVSGFNREQDALAYVALNHCYAESGGIQSATKVSEYYDWKIDMMDDDGSFSEYARVLLDGLLSVSCND